MNPGLNGAPVTAHISQQQYSTADKMNQRTRKLTHESRPSRTNAT